MLHKDAERFAQRFTAAGRLSREDREDLRQDLLLDLLGRLAGYRAARSGIRTFAALCFRHHAGRLSARHRRERAHRHTLSLDDRLPGSDGLTLADTLSEADGYSAWLGQPTDAHGATKRRLDLDRALGTLPSASLSLCAALNAGTPHDLAREGGAPRTTLYRRLRRLRLDLLAAGIGPARNGSAASWVEG